MAQFNYVDTNNKLQTVEAATPDEAIKTATNIKADSGVSIVSSSSVLTGKNIDMAVNNAANNLFNINNKNNIPPDGSYYQNGKLVTPDSNNYNSNYINTSLKKDVESVTNPILDAALNETKSSKRALELTYNAALASKNAKYESLFRNLKESYDKSIDVATDDAIALNPYSMSRGATTAKNFKQKITDNYNTASVELQRQSDLAQQELESGNYSAYVQIQNGLDKMIASTISSTNQMILDFKKQAEQSRQFEATLETKYSDDYRNYLTQVPFSPEEVQKMTDEEILNSTAGRLATKAGIADPNAIRQDMTEGSYASQKIALTAANQASLEANRDRMFALAMAKFTSSQDSGALSDKVYNLARAGENNSDVLFAPYSNLSNSERAKVSGVITGVDFINQAESLYAAAVGNEYNGTGAGVISSIKGLTRTGMIWTRTDQAWKAYIDFLDSNKAPIAKGLKGEVGNLSAPEQKDALKTFPSRFTSPDNAAKAFAIARRQALSHLTTLGETQIVNQGTQNNNPAGI